MTAIIVLLVIIALMLWGISGLLFAISGKLDRMNEQLAALRLSLRVHDYGPFGGT